MIEYLKANYVAIAWRLLYVLRWAAFLFYLEGWRQALYVIPFDLVDGFVGMPGRWWELVAVLCAIPVGLAIAQWVIAGRINGKVFLPWTRLPNAQGIERGNRASALDEG